MSQREAPQPIDVPCSRAAEAIEALRERLNVESSAVVDLSLNALDAWINSGRLIGWEDLSAAWGLRSRPPLVVHLKVHGRLWYPADFKVLPAVAVKSVCRVLRGVDPVSQIIFWTRHHGALDGDTLAQAIKNGQLPRVIQLAQALTEETVEYVAKRKTMKR